MKQRTHEDTGKGMRIRLVERDVIWRWRAYGVPSDPEAVLDAGSAIYVGRKAGALVGIVSGAMVTVR